MTLLLNEEIMKKLVLHKLLDEEAEDRIVERYTPIRKKPGIRLTREQLTRNAHARRKLEEMKDEHGNDTGI